MAQRKLTYDDLDADGKARARRLMTGDYGWSPSNNNHGELLRGETKFRHEFEAFCEKSLQASAWNDLSRVFFDEPAMDQFLVIRSQRSGICFLHAGVLWQHYLKCKRTPGLLADHKMLEISAYIRNGMSNQETHKFLVKGEGGYSVSFFSRITGIPDRKLLSCSFQARKSEDPDHFNACSAWVLRTYARLREPGLVSDFWIERAFAEGEKSVFEHEFDRAEFYSYAQTKGRAIPIMHSMVLIGVHRDEDTGTVWFLLQNFWRNKYFCLVSAEYMASCRARISFVEQEEDVSLKGSPTTVDAMYVETDLEVEECEELEGDEM